MKFSARSTNLLSFLKVARPPVRLKFLGFRGLAPLSLAVAILWVIATAKGQEAPPAPAPQPAAPQPAAPAASPAPQASPLPQAPPAPQAESQAAKPESGEITEDELKQRLVGKPLFLRGGYLGDSISFSEHGAPVGHPAVGSYTLCAVEIDKVHLTKHKVELEGARYALHFLGALPNEDPSSAVDRVKITPKKKTLRITIDREQVIKPKKAKEAAQGKKPAPGNPAPSAPAADAPESSAAAPAPAIEATGAAEQAAEPASVTTTYSTAHATRVLREALDRVFALGLDDKLRAQMPAFWQLYYQAQAASVDYHSHDPSVLRSGAVDQQARLTSSIAPDSNEYAQASGIAGRALYRVVIGADGKPGEIAVVRPIGFGLDENAVAAIRKAAFQPAQKSGQPVAESLDLAILFRIYSKRTSVAATEINTDEPRKPVLPGPYTVQHPPAPAAIPETSPASSPQASPGSSPEASPDSAPVTNPRSKPQL